jgi:hypothetical protein
MNKRKEKEGKKEENRMINDDGFMCFYFQET